MACVFYDAFDSMMDGNRDLERYEVIVVGAGQAGLATGYYLAQAGYDFVILDAGERVGDSWRQRWASLELFTPAEYNNLPGMPFPAPAGHLPSKDEMADYLDAYAERFRLPVRLRTRVEALTREGQTYFLSAGQDHFEAEHVVVATGAFQTPKVQAFAADLDPAIVQLHSSQYQHPRQLPAGDALVVGVGNSGAQIGMELAATRQTWLAGQPRGHIPRRLLGRDIFWWLWPIMKRVRRDSRFGQRAADYIGRGGGDPLVGISAEDLARSGLKRVGRIVGVKDGKPLSEEGQALDVSSVVWATGFRPDYAGIALPIFDDDGYPQHWRGVVEGEPGLYFVGLRFQYRLSSTLIGGADADARYIAQVIGDRDASPSPAGA